MGFDIKKENGDVITIRCPKSEIAKLFVLEGLKYTRNNPMGRPYVIIKKEWLEKHLASERKLSEIIDKITYDMFSTQVIISGREHHRIINIVEIVKFDGREFLFRLTESSNKLSDELHHMLLKSLQNSTSEAPYLLNNNDLLLDMIMKKED